MDRHHELRLPKCGRQKLFIQLGLRRNPRRRVGNRVFDKACSERVNLRVRKRTAVYRTAAASGVTLGSGPT